MNVAKRHDGRKTPQPRIKAWRETDGYRDLREAIERANALLDEDGIRGSYMIDASDTPFAVCFCRGDGCSTAAWWTPDGGVQLTDDGACDGTLIFALESAGL